jgi:sodium-dependent dicarboxylate transporter 2/3/5
MTNLVVAAAIGVSMDFMFPMGTPPNALAYSSGYIHTTDMVKAGAVISLIGAVILAVLGFLSWGVF